MLSILNVPAILWLPGIFLLVMTLYDIKKYKMPSVIGTTGILACSIIVLWSNPSLFFFGILGFIFAYLLYELGMFKGVADIKATILVALTIGTFLEFGLFMLLIAGINLSYVFILNKVFKVKHKKDIPLIPVFFLVWAILLFI